jgi:hypothetical protein
MAMVSVAAATFGAINMGNNDSAVDDPCQPLETFMNLLLAEYLFLRFFHKSLIVAKKTDTPAIYVLFALFRKHRQIFFGRMFIACGYGENVTHDRLQFVIFCLDHPSLVIQ